MKILRVVVSLMLSFALYGQAVLPAFDVEVKVVNRRTAEPIVGASVAIRGLGSYLANGTTDGSGKLATRGVPVGRYAVTVMKNGYSESGASVDVDSSRPLSAITVFLSASNAKINGRIGDSDGHPLAGVLVHAYRLEYPDGRLKFSSGQGTAETDDHGEYRLFGLPSGQYVVRADYTDAPVAVQLSAQSTGGNALGQRVAGNRGGLFGTSAAVAAGAPDVPPPLLVFFPGKLSPDEAQRIDVAAGAEIKGIDMTIPSSLRVSSRMISGTVATEVPGIDIARMTSSFSFFLAPKSSATLSQPISMRSQRTSGGAFALTNVPVGTFDLFAVSSIDGVPYSGRVALDESSQDIRNLLVTILPGTDLKGKVSIDGNKELINFTTLTLRLAPSDNLPLDLLGASRRTTRLNDDGSFLVKGLPMARYTVSLNGLSKNSYLEEIRLNGKSVFVDGQIAVGESVVSADLQIGTNGGVIKGIVSSGRTGGVGGSTVVLVPRDPYRENRLLYRVTAADSSGEFQLTGIAPGQYDVFAWEDISPGAWFDHDYFKKYEGKGVEITIKTGETVVASVGRIDS